MRTEVVDMDAGVETAAVSVAVGSWAYATDPIAPVSAAATTPVRAATSFITQQIQTRNAPDMQIQPILKFVFIFPLLFTNKFAVHIMSLVYMIVIPYMVTTLILNTVIKYSKINDNSIYLLTYV